MGCCTSKLCRPEHGWSIAFVGLVGKILGPIGLFVLIAKGLWPLRSIVLCITNDFVWLPSFGLYLHDAWPQYRATWIETRIRSESSTTVRERT